MDKKKYLTTSEVATLLGISRVAVFKKIKSGKIQAVKIGRNFAIERSALPQILSTVLSTRTKRDIEEAVKMVLNEYGRTLELLGAE